MKTRAESLADEIAFPFSAPYSPGVSTVLEIKEAVKKLQPRDKAALAKWLQTEIDDRMTDDEMMLIATEGARMLDEREAADATSKTR